MSDDRAFVETLLQWRAHGHDVIVMTVVRTWGSSPRPVGSLMAVRDDGRTLGSVSGGCVEEDLLERLRAGALSLDRPLRLSYGSARSGACGEGAPTQASFIDTARPGLPCGGRLELVVERVRAGDGWERIAEALRLRSPCTRRLWLDHGNVELLPAAAPFQCTDRRLDRHFGPSWRLLLVGAGDLARHIIHCAQHLDYEIVVCEPRSEVRRTWDLPEIILDSRMPDEAAAAEDHPQTAIITLAHDPRIDDLALMQALTGRSFYVGALGSKLTSGKRRERLLALGLPPERVAQLHAPVGLSIGSHTPAEIAISILAEVTAVRNRLAPQPVTVKEAVS